MKLVFLLSAVFIADCFGFQVEPEIDYPVREGELLEKRSTNISGITEPHLDESEENIYPEDRNSIEERRACTPTISCELAGGICIKRGKVCHGITDPKGCRKKKCKCCIPDQTTPPPVTCPTCPTVTNDVCEAQDQTTPPPVTCPTCPTVTNDVCEAQGPITTSILNWYFVGQDYFVGFTERMIWYDAQTLCNTYGLELYQPRNVTAVSELLAENFPAKEDTWINKQFFHIGARGNGTHMIWLSGEVVSPDEPWYTDYGRYVGTDACLTLTDYSNNIKTDKLLYTCPTCCSYSDRLNYPICGEAPSHTLTWHTVGDTDRFARYNHRMSWDNSKALCNRFGLELYQPTDFLNVSAYLYDNFPGERQTNYWVGGRGNGTDIVWPSGDIIPYNSSLWWFNPGRYNRECVMLFPISRWFSEQHNLGFIRTWYCTTDTRYPLCG